MTESVPKTKKSDRTPFAALLLRHPESWKNAYAGFVVWLYSILEMFLFPADSCDRKISARHESLFGKIEWGGGFRKGGFSQEWIRPQTLRAACLQNETAPKNFNFKTKNGPKKDPKLPRKLLSLVLLCRISHRHYSKIFHREFPHKIKYFFTTRICRHGHANKPDIAIASEVSNSSKHSLAITDFFAKRTKLANLGNYCGKPHSRNPPFLGPAFGRTDFLRIFLFEPPDFFADFLVGFFLLIFVGKVPRKIHWENPRENPRENPPKFIQQKSSDTFLQIGRGNHSRFPNCGIRHHMKAGSICSRRVIPKGIHVTMRRKLGRALKG